MEQKKKEELVNNQVIIIDDNKKLTISDSQSQKFEIHAEKDLSLELEIKTSEEAMIYLDFKKCNGKIWVKIQAHSNANVTIFSWNNTDSLLEVEEEVYLAQNAKLNMIYGELNQSEVKRNSVYYLSDKQAKLNTCMAAIAEKKKQFVFHVHHNEIDTKSDMRNYVIVQDRAEFYLDVTGKIEKGAHRSDAQQINRILTLSDQHQAVVVPQLLIDDNDVVAGHAMTMGQIDENQLYYMESRGIAREDAIQLVMLGYLTPIAYLLKEEYKVEVLTMIEEKVGAQCLISKK